MAFEELKERHAAMWGSAPFERVAGTLADMHEHVVETMVGGEGTTWLDVGCGTGELAFMAAATGADVTACDLAPNLVETARRQAAERGLEIPFEVGDAEALPYGDASFDIVTSSIGAIFAPNHAAVASELARVCRPGGRLGMTAWTKAEGGVDKFFEIIGSYAPPPPPGAGIPFEWGEPEHCEELLGPFFELEITSHNTPWPFETPDEMWDLMSESFGPIKTLLGVLPPERAAAFKADMFEFLESERTPDGIDLDRPYNLIVGTRRS
jgi:SAM-dependent methyltransferase